MAGKVPMASSSTVAEPMQLADVSRSRAYRDAIRSAAVVSGVGRWVAGEQQQQQRRPSASGGAPGYHHSSISSFTLNRRPGGLGDASSRPPRADGVEKTLSSASSSASIDVFDERDGNHGSDAGGSEEVFGTSRPETPLVVESRGERLPRAYRGDLSGRKIYLILLFVVTAFVIVSYPTDTAVELQEIQAVFGSTTAPTPAPNAAGSQVTPNGLAHGVRENQCGTGQTSCGARTTSPPAPTVKGGGFYTDEELAAIRRRQSGGKR